MNNIDKLMKVLDSRKVAQCVTQVSSINVGSGSPSSELLEKKKKYFSNTNFCTGCGCGCNKCYSTCGA